MVIRIKDLPTNNAPAASQFVATDLATTEKLTIQGVVDTGAPVASQAEAEAGVNNTKRMTPLTTAQAIAELGASAAQGALADTAVQPGDLSAVATSGNYNDLSDQPSLSADLIYPTKADAQAATIPLAEEALRINGDATVGDGLGGLYIDTDNGSADTFDSSGGTARTWYRAPDVSATRLVGSPDIRNFLDTAPYVATRTALKALDTTKDTTAILKEAGREGIFNWTTGDFSAEIAIDTAEGVYIEADAIAATVGAWVRADTIDKGLSPFIFGGVGSGVLGTEDADTAAIKCASQLSDVLDLSGGDWLVKDGQWPGYSGDELRTVVLVDGRKLTVRGDSCTVTFLGEDVSEYATMFRAVNGGSIVVDSNLVYDYYYRPYTQGVVLSKTATHARFQIDTTTFGTPTWTTVQRIAVYEADTLNYVSTALEVGGAPVDKPFTLVSAGVYDVDLTSDPTALAALTVGNTCVLYHKVNGYYFTYNDGGSIDLENVEVNCTAGMAFAGSHVDDVHIGANVKIRPALNTACKIATTSDGLHFNGISGQCYIAPELIAGTSDDAANINIPMGGVQTLVPGAPYNQTIHDTFLWQNFTPSITPAAGEYLFGIATDGSQVNMGKVLSVSTVAPASVTYPAITMDQVIPASIVATSLVGSYTWVCAPYYAPAQVRNTRGGGAVIRGIGPTIRGNYLDITGPAVSMVAFWGLYDEGPVSMYSDVDVYIRNAGEGQDSVPGALRIDAVTLDGASQSPAAVMVGGSFKAVIEDCRVGAVWATSFDSSHFNIIERNTNYDPWLSVPQPTATGYFQNCNNCVVEWAHLGSGNAIVYFQNGLRNSVPASNSKVTYAGTGYLTYAQNILVGNGGNSVGAGGSIAFRSNTGAFADLHMSSIGGYLENAPSGEQQGGVTILTRPTGAAGQTLTERFRVHASGIVQVSGSAWNAGHLQLGAYHLWVDGTGDLRIKSSAPASDTDGTVVGTQT